MVDTTQFAKVVEFLHRTKMAEKIMEEPSLTTETMISYLMLLPVKHNWDVDAAVKSFQEAMEVFEMDSSVADFDATTLIENHHPTWSQDEGSIEEFNRKFFGYQIENKLVSQPNPPEP